jgi:hypothetical protein
MRNSAAGTFAIASFLLLLGGCTSERLTSPPRTAEEQLLISTAADRAAEKLAQQIPPRIKMFLDATYINAPDANYATLAIRDRLLRHGAFLVDDKASAEAIVQVRAGALSTDESGLYVGTPSLTLPVVPTVASGGILLPSLSLFKRAEIKATAKFAATGYDPKTGQLVLATDPQFGYSERVDWVIAILFSWTNQDYLENRTMK